MQSVLYLAILVSLASQAAVACPGRCLCFRTTVRCMFLQLDNIPENIPAQTTILDLRFNRIKHIEPGAFKGLKNLHTLLLNNNHLKSIPGQAFDGLISLRYLYLYKNQIETIDHFAFQGLEKVEQIYIHFNQIEEIKPKTFANLPSIQRLFLHNNKLKRLPKGVFVHVPSLRRLGISKYDHLLIDNILAPIGTIQELNIGLLLLGRLDSNALICDCKMMWLAQMLQHDMRHTQTAATCKEPRGLQGKSLSSVKMEEFHCKKPLLKADTKGRVDVSFGKTAYFKCQAEGDPDPEIIWFHNNITIPVDNLNEKYNLLDDGTLMIKNPVKADQGVYECVAKNDLGEAKSPGVELRYLGDDPAPRIQPAFTKVPTDAVVNQGGTVTLECYAQGAPRPTITWNKNGVTSLIRNPRFTILAEGPLVISNIEFEDRGIYSCVARNILGVISSSVGVLVQIPPRFVEVPQDQSVIEGQPASLRCRARGYPPPKVQWIKDNVVQPTTSRQSLENLNGGSRLIFSYIRRIADRGQYECVASSEAGTVVARAQLNVVSRVPPTFTLRPRDTVAYTLDEVRLPCQVQGEPPPRIRWYLGTDHLRDSNKYSFQGGALIIHNVTRADEGRYECQASNEIDTIRSIAILKVKDNSQQYIGDRYVNASLHTAIREVNSAFNKTLQELYDKERVRSPSDLLTIFRLPSPHALAVTRSSEIFERTLENVLHHVAGGDSYNVTHTGADLTYEEIISPAHLQIIANLSGCLNHRHVVECEDMCFHSQYRTADGTCNNLQNPMMGASLTALQRMLKPRYDNGISTPTGWNRNKLHHGHRLPSARLISTKLIATNTVTEDEKHTHMLMQWGQFMDHDISFTPMAVSNSRFSDGRHCNETCENQSPCFPIEVPLGDPRIHRFKCLGFTRSSSMCGTGVTSGFLRRVAARQQLNQITSFIDASNVYGSSEEEANNLRNLQNEQGFLKVGITPRNGRSFLPYNINAPVDCQIDPTRAHIPCFIAGDHRANEQLGLLSLHTIWMREHNRMAEVLLRNNPHWDGDHVYHETRKIIGATMQHITYSQWLPKVLGDHGMRMMGTYQGYNPNVDASILNVFATAAFRFGHSLIQPIIFRLDNRFQQTEYGNLPLHKAFFAPYRLVEEGGVDPILRGLFHIGMKKPEPDHLLNTELTERLFRLAHAVALDLAALNIQRGRDHGLPSYNSFRKYCNLTEGRTFADYRREIRNVEVLRKLEDVYGHPDNVDLWVGGLVEEPIPGSRLGPTFMCIIVDQFRRLRDGDRFWYENPGVFSASQLTQIKQSSVARVICDNNDGTLDRIQNDVFVKMPSSRDYGECEDVPKMDLKVWTDCCRDCSRNSYVNTFTNQLRQRRSTEYSYPGDRPQEQRGAPESIVVADDSQSPEEDAMESRMEGVEGVVEKLNQFVGKLSRKVRRLEKQLKEEKSFCIDEQGVRRRHNEVWKEDACKTCKCKFSKVRCEDKQCPSVDCELPRIIPGQCCPVC